MLTGSSWPYILTDSRTDQTRHWLSHCLSSEQTVPPLAGEWRQSLLSYIHGTSCREKSSTADAGVHRVLYDRSAMSRKCSCVPHPAWQRESEEWNIDLYSLKCIVTYFYIILLPWGVAAIASCLAAAAWPLRPNDYDPKAGGGQSKARHCEVQYFWVGSAACGACQTVPRLCLPSPATATPPSHYCYYLPPRRWWVISRHSWTLAQILQQMPS